MSTVLISSQMERNERIEITDEAPNCYLDSNIINIKKLEFFKDYFHENTVSLTSLELEKKSRKTNIEDFFFELKRMEIRWNQTLI